MNVVGRLRDGILRRGVRGSVRAAAHQALRNNWLHTVHIWYELELNGDRPRREMPEGLRLRPGTAADLEFAAAQSAQVGITTVNRRHAAGDELWIVEGEEPAFSCWIFRGATPCLAAPGESLDLPEGVAGLDDSNTTASARGRGVAPAAWTAIADMLAAEGVRAMVTPVEEENTASRRAVQKAGFAEVAVLHTHRRPWGTHVSVDGEPGELADELRKLER